MIYLQGGRFYLDGLEKSDQSGTGRIFDSTIESVGIVEVGGSDTILYVDFISSNFAGIRLDTPPRGDPGSYKQVTFRKIR